MQSELISQPSPATAGKAFGAYLVSQGILRPEVVRQALETQIAMGGRIDTVLLDMGLLSESALLEALGQFHSTRTASGTDLASTLPVVARMISPRMAARLEIVPFRHQGKTLSVATLNPSDLLVEDELALLTDSMISSYVALEARLYEALERLYGVQPSIQIRSVLTRLNNGERGPRSTTEGPTPAVQAPHPPPVQPPEPPPAQPTPPRARRSSDYDTADIPEEPTREDQVSLEISQEDLELFPSLRTEAAGKPGAPLRLHGRPPDQIDPADHESRLRSASMALQNAEMREDIADALLSFCAPILRRRMLLAVRKDTVIGWRAEGDDVEPAAIRKISIPLSEPSVFLGLTQGTEFWLGALPDLPGNRELIRGIGGTQPSESVILPLIVRTKTVCFLYGDNVDDSVTGLPISHLRRLVAKASLAFQVYILKSKIRNL
jgi:hypothetical protein